MNNLFIESTEKGIGIILVPEGKDQCDAKITTFAYDSVEIVDYIAGDLKISFKSGAIREFKMSDGIAYDDVRKIWETVLDNM
jgi:hypothetical protein